MTQANPSKLNRFLLTGGAGFVGSHVFERLAAAYPDASITVLDKMTYAADFQNIVHVLDREKRTLTVGSITDLGLCDRLTRDVDCIIHVAAESHVDNSFGNSLEFTMSNTYGTHVLLESARRNGVQLFLHVSTDEVYGEVVEGESNEGDKLNPTNPYSASKASAEMIVGSFIQSYALPVITVRANNIFGIRQYPEKIVPKFTMQLLSGQPVTIHGDGSHRRKYLAAEDFAEAILLLIREGEIGGIYNVGNNEEYTNIEVAEMICRQLQVPMKENMTFVDDRPFNDRRYSINFDKIRALGWAPTISLADSIPRVTDWYKDHQSRYRKLFVDGA